MPLPRLKPLAPSATLGRKPQQRGLRSARKLLDAAATLFVEKGVEETTIDEIVQFAGSAKGTFYHHYESKAALLLALRQNVLDQYQAQIDAALAKCVDRGTQYRLDAWVRATCDAYVGMGALQGIVFANISRWTDCHAKHIRDLVAIMEEGSEKGLWKVDQPDTASSYVFRGIIGTIDDLLLTGRPLTGLKRKMIALVHCTVGL